MDSDQGCMFESSGIVSAIDDMATELTKSIEDVKDSVDEHLGEFNFSMLFSGLRTISEQLEEQTNLVKLIVELYDQR